MRVVAGFLDFQKTIIDGAKVVGKYFAFDKKVAYLQQVIKHGYKVDNVLHL